MTARILIVDDVPANVKLLQARLTADYYEVLTASSGAEALQVIDREDCDLVLLDVMMPGMDGVEVCRRLKENPKTAHIPVVMLTALDQPNDKLEGLEAGADDFLTKPVNDIALLTRVKSLARLKMLTDELRMRVSTSREMGVDETALAGAVNDGGAEILIVDNPGHHCQRMAEMLGKTHQVSVEADPQRALFRVAEESFELIIISLALENFDPLRLCSQIRSLERTRLLPLLLVTTPDDNARLMRGLDLGVNDYIMRPIDENELNARIRTQIRRKRFTDKLREDIEHTMELAVTDSLTGLHNRRYLESHLANLIKQTSERGKDLSLMILDIDFFKSINDTYGHDSGDEVLREFARRIAKSTRGLDLVCRLGGEEFVVVMPETDLSYSQHVAERLRRLVAEEPFDLKGPQPHCSVTVSIGIAPLLDASETAEQLLKRADEALYIAKRDGRNRVVSDAA